MIHYIILIALARYPFYVLHPRSYGRAFRVRPRTAWAVTCTMVWLVAMFMSLWPQRDVAFYAGVLGVPVVFTAVMVAIATTGWPHLTRAFWWAVLGYLLGFVVRDAFPAPSFALDFSLPAVYAATGAVLACWTG